MPKGRKYLTKDDNTWLATCRAREFARPGSVIEIDMAECEWDRICTTEKIARVASVLHVLVKHPDAYQVMTGKDPEAAMHEYSEQITAMRRYL